MAEPRFMARIVPGMLVLAIGLFLVWAVLSLPVQATGLGDQVEARLTQSGVRNPVTAVVINFRGYDTLLEMGVLVLAALGVWTLQASAPPHSLEPGSLQGPVLAALVRLVSPVMVLVAVYMLWVGGHAPGGAFQGGAILGAAGVLLVLADTACFAIRPGWLWRTLLFLGFAVFLLVALGMMTSGNHFLEYPRNWAGGLILLIEGTSMVSIACILVFMFAGGPSAVTFPSPPHTPSRDHPS